MRYPVGGCELDVDARQLTRGGAEVHLSPKAFALLEHLVTTRPRAISKQDLYDHLWPGTFVVEANLAILIREVREALGDSDKKIIRTVHRHGYACAAEVSPGNPAAAHVLMLGEREWALHAGDNIVGRDHTAAVRISSTSVSRQHAVIHVDDDRATLTDLGSKNGTTIDGTRVTAPVILHDGALVEFGKVAMVYRWAPAVLATETIG